MFLTFKKLRDVLNALSDEQLDTTVKIDLIRKEQIFDGHAFVVFFDYSETNHGTEAYPLSAEGKAWFAKEENRQKVFEQLKKEKPAW